MENLKKEFLLKIDKPYIVRRNPAISQFIFEYYLDKKKNKRYKRYVKQILKVFKTIYTIGDLSEFKRYIRLVILCSK